MNEELLKKAKAAKSAGELLELAKANSVELTEAEAESYFSQLHQSGELSDEELSAVAGGGCQAEGLAHRSNDLKVGDVIRCYNTEAFNDHYEACPCGNTYFRITKLDYGRVQNQVKAVCTKCGREETLLNETGYSFTMIIV